MMSHTDFNIDQLIKTSKQVEENGVFSGKMGFAILLFRLSKTHNNSKILHQTDNLIDSIVQDEKITGVSFFDEGLGEIAWGFHYLMTSGYLSVDDDFFEKIDKLLFEHIKKIHTVDRLPDESAKACYLSRRLKYDKPNEKSIWEQRAKTYIQTVTDILRMRYLMNRLPVFACKDLFPILFLCQTLATRRDFKTEIDILYEEIAGLTEVSLQEDNSIADRYAIHQLILDMPFFSEFVCEIPDIGLISIPEINRFYYNELISENSVAVPETIKKHVSYKTITHESHTCPFFLYDL